MKPLLIFLFLVIFQSCSMYKDSFDCPIPEGTPCKSVTQIEGMIVERKEGSDLFVLTKENDCACTHSKMMNGRKIWLCTHKAPNEVVIKGKRILMQIEDKLK